jgi:hypothetical protein
MIYQVKLRPAPAVKVGTSNVQLLMLEACAVDHKQEKEEPYDSLEDFPHELALFAPGVHIPTS